MTSYVCVRVGRALYEENIEDKEEYSSVCTERVGTYILFKGDT